MSAILSPVESCVSATVYRYCRTGDQPTVLADIYQDDINIAIWQRHLTRSLIQAADHMLDTNPSLQISTIVTSQNVYATVNDALGAMEVAVALSEHITQLVDMFCCLFDLKHVGLRLTSLEHAMCPRFHVDSVSCRLVTTYRGIATQWLPHHLVDRSKLGAGNQDKPDERSGLFEKITDIQQLGQGDVGLLKGELWHGNEGAGLVHRSPDLSDGKRRLLLTLDIIHD